MVSVGSQYGWSVLTMCVVSVEWSTLAVSIDGQCWQSVWIVSVGSQCGWSVLTMCVVGVEWSTWAVSVNGQCRQSLWVISVDSVSGQFDGVDGQC